MEIPGLNFKLLRETLTPGLKNIFFDGNEIKATVIKGGNPGETAVMRSGKHIFQARIEGGDIRDNDSIFLRIEKKMGNFRLILLKNLRDSGSTFIQKGFDNISLQIFSKFLGLYESPVYIQNSLQKQKDKKELFNKIRDLKKYIPDSLKKVFQELENIMESDLEKDTVTEIAFFQNFEKNKSISSNTGNLKDVVYGGGNIQKNSGYFFTVFSFDILGKIGLGIFSEDGNFESVNICIVPFKSETYDLAVNHVETVKNLLGNNIIQIRNLEIIKSSDLNNISYDTHA